ncbi:unnamed protein product, partial [Rotaria sp. Silwood1]
MPSDNTFPSQSLINAAVQSFFAGAVGVAIGGPFMVAAAIGSAVNVVQIYHASLVPAVYATGDSIPRKYLRGPLQIDMDCLAPEFDYDYTNIRDNDKKFRRGNQPYERPCGSRRIALKVTDKFGPDNAWLGMKGDAPDEWPVSYHGTARHNAMNIAEGGFKLSKGKRFL